MPFAIDEDRMVTDPTKVKPGVKTLTSLDPADPPRKSIPHANFPMVVYKHPKEAFRKVEHRNTAHEIVEVEHVPSEHLNKLVRDSAELETALARGWVKEPYIAEAPPDPNAELYADSAESKSKAKK
jgi:hypothetical protein